MSREDEIAQVREQVGVLAEQVGTLLDIISRRTSSGADTTTADDKLEVLETLMWKLHRRQSRLKAAASSIGREARA
ncbi:MAG: hypothetical protein Q8R02_06380 [Hyphomonadaceae bacterium]|nr:hypothetical protein [Hyphomonadaceae bacterium]